PPAAPEAPATTAPEAAVGHTQALPAEPVVTTAAASVEPAQPAVKPAPPSVQTGTATTPRPRVDFALLRTQITLEAVLRHLGVFAGLRGRGRNCVVAARCMTGHAWTDLLGASGQAGLPVLPSRVWSARQRLGPVGQGAGLAALRGRVAFGRHLRPAPEQRR